MELDYAILALNADFDADGKVHLFGGAFDILNVAEMPANLPPFMLVARFIVPPNDFGQRHQFSVQLSGPAGSGEVVPQSSIVAERKAGMLADDPASCSVLVPLRLRIPEAGRYTFQLFLDGKPVKSISIAVRVSQETQQ